MEGPQQKGIPLLPAVQKVLMLTRRVGEGFRLDRDILVDVLEITDRGVRLGIVPPDGMAIHLSPEPKAELEGGRPRFLVAQERGKSVVINDSTQLIVQEIEADRVCFGILQNATEEVTPDVLLGWVARQINRYLETHERGAKELARKVGVAPATITRWRSRSTNISTEYLEKLLPALGVSLDDMARDLEVPRIVLPVIKRGPESRRIQRVQWEARDPSPDEGHREPERPSS